MASTSKLVELFNSYADASLASSSATAFVTAAYENLLGLTGDFSNKDKRIAYWVERLEDGLDRDDFASTFLNLAENTQGDLLTDTEFALNKAVITAIEALDESSLTLDSIKEKALETVASQNATITASVSSVNEGGSVTYTISDAKASTEYTYTISGVSADDVTGGSLTGTVTTDADGTATFSVSLVEDKTTEGTETLTVALDGTVATKSISVADTSEGLSLTASASSVSEGDTITYTVANGDASTTYNYTITGVSTSDVTGGSLTGSFTTDSSGAATFTIVPVSDSTTEDAETLTVTIDNTTVSAAVSVSDPSTGGTGQTFTLTTGDDTSIFGTTGSDTYTATQTTYTGGDLIVDATTTDNDTLTVTATDDISATPIVTGIENVNFNLSAFTTSGTASEFSVDAANISSGTVALDVTQTGATVTDAQVDNVKTGVTVSLSDDFTTGGVEALDNAAITINTAASNFTDLTLTNDSGNVDDVTVNATGKLTLTSTGNDGDLTITAGGDLTITDADTAAGTVSLSSTGKLNIDDLEGATTVTLAGAGTGTSKSDWTETDNTAAVQTLNLSGNGAAFELNATAGDLTALRTVAMSGTQDVKLSVSGTDVDGLSNDRLTVTDSTTAGTTTLDFHTIGTVDTTNIATDVISFSADFAGDTITVATGQTIDFTVDQGSAVNITAASTTASTNTLTIDLADDAALTTAVDAEITATNIKTLTINAQDTETKNVLTALNVGTSNNVVVNASGEAVEFATSVTASKLTLNSTTGTAVALGTLGAATLTTLDASGSSDAVTVTTGATLKTISGGSGADVVTATDEDITFDGNGGTDTFDAGALDFSDNTLTLSDIEIIHADNGADFKSSLLSGKSYIITDDTTSASVAIVADNGTVNLGSLTVDTAKITELAISATALAAANSALSITGTATADNVTATGGTSGTVTVSLGAGNDTLDANDATGVVSATMGAGDDTVTSGSAADFIYMGDAATATGDTATAGAGNDTITQGEGASTITAGVGSNSITLTETTAAEDTVIMTTAQGATDYDTITGFDFGGTSTDDDFQISIGHAAASAMINGNGADIIATDVVSIQEFSTSGTLAATEEIVVLTDATFANLSAVETAIEVGGTHAVTLTSAYTQNDDLLVLWSDGSHSYLSSFNLGGTGATTIASASIDASAHIVKFAGVNVSVAGTVSANDFDAFIA